MLEKKKGGNTGLAHTASAMRQEPWHIVASTTLNNSATWVSYTHRSILYPTPVIRDTQHCVQWTQDEHIPMLHSSTNTGMYIWCPNLFPRHFLWNTNAPATRSGLPHNALHSPSFIVCLCHPYIKILWYRSRGADRFWVMLLFYAEGATGGRNLQDRCTKGW